MKIEVDLMVAHDSPDVGRATLVALMCVLPQDEVEMAVDEWQAVLKVRAADDAAMMESLDDDVSRETPIVADIEDTLPFEVAKPKSRKKAEAVPANGGVDPHEAMDLRALCRHAELQVGRDKVVEVLKAHGVTKLTGLDVSLEAKVRADVVALLP